MSRIFISYKRVDKDKVFKIKDQIESALDEKCWIDIDGIESDAQFINVIIKAIRECEVLLFMYSKTHAQITDFEKDWTVRELNFASKKEKRIVFVNIDGSPLSDEFEFMYGTKQQVDAKSNNAMSKLCADLRIWLNISTVQPNYAKNTVSSLPSLKSQNDDLTFTVGNVEFKMIRVEGGSFTMGATQEISYPNDNEKPSHIVKLSSYYIGETQVTQALWIAIMGNNPSLTKEDHNLPVSKISYDECQRFIKKLNKETGKRFRLPTESEWEFAARGGNKSNHTQYCGSSDIDDIAWYYGNAGYRQHPVKTKKANELGLYDMSGNVWEWCNDWFGEYRSALQLNPTGPQLGSEHVLRGGSIGDASWFCRVSCRIPGSGVFPDFQWGFRLALSE